MSTINRDTMSNFLNLVRWNRSNSIDTSGPDSLNSSSSNSSDSMDSWNTTESSQSTGTAQRPATRYDTTTSLFSESSAAAPEGYSFSPTNRSYSTTRLSRQLENIMCRPTDIARDIRRERRHRLDQDQSLLEMSDGRHTRDLGLNGLPRELYDGLEEFLQTQPHRSGARSFSVQRSSAQILDNAPPPPYSSVDTFVAQMAACRTWEETLAALTALEEDDHKNRGKLPDYSFVDALIILPTYPEVTRTKSQKGKRVYSIWKGIEMAAKIVWNGAVTRLNPETGAPSRWRVFT